MAEHFSSHRTGHITPDEGLGAVQEASEQSGSPASMDPQSTLWPRRSLIPVNNAVQKGAFETCSTLHSIHTPADRGDGEPTSGRMGRISRPIGHRKDMDSFIHFILSSRTSNVFELGQFDLRLLDEASQQPPITMIGLNQLEVSNIIGSPRMRHDLNFDKEAKVNPSHDNDMGELRRAKARKYWKALTVELALYMECTLKKCDGCLLHTVTLPNKVWRMKEVFATLKDILKNLMREEDEPAIEQSLDVRLLMQQLNKGICDLKSLSNWFGRIIKGSCSPIRDDEVNDTVELLKRAIDTAQPFDLARGLENLFTLFETMKLDIANHQLRSLRILIISDSTEYVREHFTNRIRGSAYGEPQLSTGQLNTARAWYVNAMKHGREDQGSDDPNEEEPFPPGSHDIILLGRGIRDLIRFSAQESAVTFEYDQARLNVLRRDYRQTLFADQVAYVFKHNLRARGVRAELHERCKKSLLSRISQLQTAAILSPEVFLDSVSLEIVRAIYDACGITNVPSEADVAFVRQTLCACSVPSNDSFKIVEKKLCEDLDVLLEKEITDIYDLPCLQISNRYENLTPPSDLGKNPEQRTLDLHSLAVRIAHITVLHWRVWAPILYFSPQDNDFDLPLHDGSGGEPHRRGDGQGGESAARTAASTSPDDGEGEQSQAESETVLQRRAEWQSR